MVYETVENDGLGRNMTSSTKNRRLRSFKRYISAYSEQSLAYSTPPEPYCYTSLFYTYTVEDYIGWLGGFDRNIMLTGCGYDYNEEGSIVKHRFMDYSGTPLFSGINYLSGTETDLSMDTAAEE
ncbi:hypothetical protein [Blautia sp. 1033sp1_1033st1_G9_1033SCRN_220408]|uniref:hypothetical protein n=1 Tax=Blautia sp. 1033sp1_1033st1_G9_1033SCRN_220408 TaxID=3144490 RepID=UPI0034A5CF97